MKISLQQVAASIFAVLILSIFLVYVLNNSELLGEKPLFVRALMINVVLIAALVAVYPFSPFFTGRPISYCALICLPAIVPAFLFYFFIFPVRMSGGFEASHVESTLISDRSSNGIIEVGFQYPIYTPKISITSQEMFTQKVNVFLRLIDNSGENFLFRAVRSEIPGENLSVESSVQGMLSENSDYLFNPIDLAPGKEIIGKTVFIVSNLEDGAAFTDALRQGYLVHFELRNPENGLLLLEFPLDRI